ncbi:retron system putative HNH endonuclease [Roseburia faecis]|jgi:TIGR02646 family protein|uniref:retron system putative HNH endonuclease n=1 Tax=Roseburia faecis TaxID=301302 RepID=UPI0018A8CF5D|nr:retron system putative HNH endonuclease [Roseburia faecis]
MKRIYKNDEPQEILQWKSKFKNKNGRVPRYSDLNEVENLPHKIFLKNSLISEQGHICCYCCKPIDTKNSHIEHIRPKERNEYRAISLEYENLLASCQGYHDREENCGHSKDNAFNEELFVSPLEENCESLFEFSNRGKIKAVDGNERAGYTIELLNLDTEQLNAARTEAMWVSGAMDELTEDECRRLLDKFQSVDERGRYAGFSDAIVYQLKKQLAYLTRDK